MHIASTSTSLITSGLPSLCRSCSVLKGIDEHSGRCRFSHSESHRLQISVLIQPSSAPFVRTRRASSASLKHMKEPFRERPIIVKPQSCLDHCIRTSVESSGLLNYSQEGAASQHADSTNWQNGQFLDLKSPKVPRYHVSESNAEKRLTSLYLKGILEHCSHKARHSDRSFGLTIA